MCQAHVTLNMDGSLDSQFQTNLKQFSPVPWVGTVITVCVPPFLSSLKGIPVWAEAVLLVGVGARVGFFHSFTLVLCYCPEGISLGLRMGMVED
jgi:hypothetical protein